MTRVLALVLTVVALAGCASGVTGHNEPPRSAPPPAAGQVVFQVEAGRGGLEPYAIALAALPAVTIYGDGQAFAPMESRAFTGAPSGVMRGRVTSAMLRRLVVDAERSGLFDDVDFGEPHVSDLGATSVEFRPSTARARRATAYALEFRDGDDALSSTQRRHRQALRAFIRDLTRAVHYGDTDEWLPAQIDVTESQAHSTSSGTAPTWPGPALATLLSRHRLGDHCGLVTGAQARRVYLAARDNSGIRWMVDGRQHELVVRPLLPGQSGCRQ